MSPLTPLSQTLKHTWPPYTVIPIHGGPGPSLNGPHKHIPRVPPLQTYYGLSHPIVLTTPSPWFQQVPSAAFLPILIAIFTPLVLLHKSHHISSPAHIYLENAPLPTLPKGSLIRVKSMTTVISTNFFFVPFSTSVEQTVISSTLHKRPRPLQHWKPTGVQSRWEKKMGLWLKLMSRLAKGGG